MLQTGVKGLCQSATHQDSADDLVIPYDLEKRENQAVRCDLETRHDLASADHLEIRHRRTVDER